MKVVIAVDDTECSSLALDYVLDRHWQREDRFLIVSVVEPFSEVNMEEDENGDENEENYFKEMTDSCSKLNQKCVYRLNKKVSAEQITSKVLKGPAAEKIVQSAYDFSADLIIMGTHGHTECRRFLPCSVSETVLKQSPCSVEVIKTKRTPVKTDLE